MIADEPADGWPVPLDFWELGLSQRRPRRKARAAALCDPPGRGFHPEFVLSLFSDATPTDEASSPD